MSIETRGYMARVPEMERFLTVDELARDLEDLAGSYPGLTRHRRVGTSRRGGDPAAQLSGASSDDCARKYGTTSLVVEMPYDDDPRSNVRRETTTSRRDAILGGLALRREQLSGRQQ